MAEPTPTPAELFYRGPDPKRHLVAAAQRLIEAMSRGIRQVPGEAGRRLLALFDADTLWTIGIAAAAGFISTLAAGVAATAATGGAAAFVGGAVVAGIDLLLAGVAVHSVYESIAKPLGQAIKTAYWASSDAELAAAGAYFAAAAGEVPLFYLEAKIGGKAFKMVRGQVLSRLPRPIGLPAVVVEAVPPKIEAPKVEAKLPQVEAPKEPATEGPEEARRRAQAAQDAQFDADFDTWAADVEAGRAEGPRKATAQAAGEGPPEKAPSPEESAAQERQRRARRLDTLDLVRGAGGRGLATSSPWGWVAAGVAVLAAAGVTTAAVAWSSSNAKSNKRREAQRE